MIKSIVEPPIKDPLRKGQPSYKEHTSGPLPCSSRSFLTSEKRTTSQRRTKWSIEVSLWRIANE